jgi:hypothetical protein
VDALCTVEYSVYNTFYFLFAEPMGGRPTGLEFLAAPRLNTDLAELAHQHFDGLRSPSQLTLVFSWKWGLADACKYFGKEKDYVSDIDVKHICKINRSNILRYCIEQTNRVCEKGLTVVHLAIRSWGISIRTLLASGFRV